MVEAGRTGPHDPRRQSDLELGFETERADRLAVTLRVRLTEAEAQTAIRRGVEAGYKRENPNWAWSEHEKRDAVRAWLQRLIEEDLNR